MQPISTPHWLTLGPLIGKPGHLAPTGRLEINRKTANAVNPGEVAVTIVNQYVATVQKKIESVSILASFEGLRRDGCSACRNPTFTPFHHSTIRAMEPRSIITLAIQLLHLAQHELLSDIDWDEDEENLKLDDSTVSDVVIYSTVPCD
jgi:hypothetical protein